jgi:hypothetical protein
MRNFIRKYEDFTCLNCGAKVKGNGYTDHCPVCLYSRHVDINPGDRQSECMGVMVPVRRIYMRTYTELIYRCKKCLAEKKVRCSPEDSESAVISVPSR